MTDVLQDTSLLILEVQNAKSVKQELMNRTGQPVRPVLLELPKRDHQEVNLAASVSRDLIQLIKTPTTVENALQELSKLTEKLASLVLQDPSQTTGSLNVKSVQEDFTLLMAKQNAWPVLKEPLLLKDLKE